MRLLCLALDRSAKWPYFAHNDKLIRVEHWALAQQTGRAAALGMSANIAHLYHDCARVTVAATLNISPLSAVPSFSFFVRRLYGKSIDSIDYVPYYWST